MTAAAAAPGYAGADAAGPGLHRLAPDFTRTDLAGRPVHLRAYRGQVVLLNFWASWCGPCLAEIPRFSVWEQHYGRSGLQILGIAMNDERAPVLRTVGRFHLAYPVVIGDAQLGMLYGGVMGLPETFLIDAEGRIAARYEGDADLPRMESQIKALLPHPPR